MDSPLWEKVITIKDCYYFSHDANAKDDPKCVMLIEQLGPEGYGIYWILIETLRDQPGYKYPVTLIPAIARRYNTTAEKMKTVVNAYGLFVVDENNFFSLSLIERMMKFETKRELARLAGKKSAERRQLFNDNSTTIQRQFNDNSTTIQRQFNDRSTTVQRPFNDGSTTVQPNKGKERKVKTYTANFDGFWSSYPKKKAKSDAIKAWAKILPSEELLAEIMDALEKHKESKDWIKDGGSFIPYPATWLNGKRWEDDVETKEDYSKVKL